MNIFKQYWGIDSQLDSLVKFNTRESFQNGFSYKIYTYTPKCTRNQTDDMIYAQNNDLVKYLPRSFSIVTDTLTGSIIGTVCGPRKFTGPDLSDDDIPEGTGNVLMETNSKTVLQWERELQLQMIVTEKVNGKFAILSILKDQINDQILFVGGSKNSHYIISQDSKDSRDFGNTFGNILPKIVSQINKYKDTLYEILQDNQSNNCSIVGELNDGQHFTKGDDEIKWFGLIEKGLPRDPIETLGKFKQMKIPHVHFYEFKGTFKNVFDSSRILENEGSVIYCRNKNTEKVVLFKSKSTVYIVKRFLRQILLKGTREVARVKKRFIDAKDYHGLGTEASIRITRLFYTFASWFAKKGYPPKVLLCISESSNIQVLPRGFSECWSQFLTETGESDIKLELKDFGTFDEYRYCDETKLDTCPLKPVVYLQGIQGSGKSTISDLICREYNYVKVEQDNCFGDTLAAQGQLFHYLCDPDIKGIVISRCNLNEHHYEKYLEISHKALAKVTFITLDCPIQTAVDRVKQRTDSVIFFQKGMVRFGTEYITLSKAIQIITNSAKIKVSLGYKIDATCSCDEILQEIKCILKSPKYIVPKSYLYIGLLVSDNSLLLKFINSMGINVSDGSGVVV